MFQCYHSCKKKWAIPLTCLLSHHKLKKLAIPHSMDKSQTSNLEILKNPIFFSVVIPFVYWIYLALHTQMVIVFDAMLFEKFGATIYKQGWTEFLRTGPHNEPLYPLLISLSMRLSDALSISYQSVQKVLQMIILLSTQLLTIKLLNELKINRRITAAVIFYLGISPAMINSVFSLWSEIAATPFVVGIILLFSSAWKNIFITNIGKEKVSKEDVRRALATGLMLGAVFAGVTFVKAIFQVIFLIFILLFLLFSFTSVIGNTKNKSQTALRNARVAVFSAFVIYQACVLPYMFANLKFNGHFTIADRGPWIVYAKAAKRAEKITPKDFGAAVAYAAGEGVCKKFWGQTECLKWSAAPVDTYGHSKLEELKTRGISGKEIDRTLLQLTLEKIRERPFQYAVLMSVEGFKMMFWESTKIGYVKYPPGLERFYDWAPVKDGLRFLLSFLTMAALGYSFFYVWKNRRKLHAPTAQSTLVFTLGSILIFLMIYIGMYSFFFIVPRHIFPIVPLYLVVIAFFIQNNYRQSRQ